MSDADATVGLVVNPAAGRDIRRLTGGASVSDNYAKRRTAGCVLAGLAMASERVAVRVMPDRADLGRSVVDEAPDSVDAELLDLEIDGSAEDTRRAAARFRECTDAVVVLGGDGTNRDVAHAIGDVPIASVSTGTNNVVPTPVDGTVAGAAAALVATGSVPIDECTTSHGMVEARIDGADEPLRGLATLGVVDRPFVGTRAVTDTTDFVGGVVSRAAPSDIGLSGIAGVVAPHAPATDGGVALRLGSPDETPQAIRAITSPGVVDRVGIEEYRRVDSGEETTFGVREGVLSVDGEREREIVDATVRIRPIATDLRFVAFDVTLDAAAERRLFSE